MDKSDLIVFFMVLGFICAFLNIGRSMTVPFTKGVIVIPNVYATFFGVLALLLVFI